MKDSCPHSARSQQNAQVDGDESLLSDDKTKTFRHTLFRKRTKDATYKAAARMANYYNRKKCVKSRGLAVGDRVTLCVPRLDRTATGRSRIHYIITAVQGDKVKSYYTAMQFGYLKNTFRRGDLEEYSGMVSVIHDKTLSLREAARKLHPENRFTKSHGNYTSGCKNDHCSSRQNNIHFLLIVTNREHVPTVLSQVQPLSPSSHHRVQARPVSPGHHVVLELSLSPSHHHQI